MRCFEFPFPVGRRGRSRLRDCLSRLLGRSVAGAAALALLAGCGGSAPAGAVRVWCHQGQEAENRAMRAIVDGFNEARAGDGVRVEIEFFPDYQYMEKLLAAAAAGDMPDALDIDGPTVAQLVDAGLLMPIDRWIGPEDRGDFLPTIIEQGTIDGRLYALGAFDSALVLYYDRTMLHAAGVGLPDGESGWTWEEFLDACRALRAAGMDPVALHMGETADEWFTYGFSPLIWSAGGELISADGRVDGVLNSDTNVAVLSAWRRLFEEDLASTSPVDPDPFGSGKTAMDWSGHWMARRHEAAKGEALGVMPLPRFGPHPAAACGSWCWGISSSARDPDAAAAWLRWATDAATGIVPIVRANGAVPARARAFDAVPEFGKEPYSTFRRLLETSGHPRPRTVHYAALSQHVAAALRDIARGADVRATLDKAAASLQAIVDRRSASR